MQKNGISNVSGSFFKNDGNCLHTNADISNFSFWSCYTKIFKEQVSASLRPKIQPMCFLSGCFSGLVLRISILKEHIFALQVCRTLGFFFINERWFLPAKRPLQNYKLMKLVALKVTTIKINDQKRFLLGGLSVCV